MTLIISMALFALSSIFAHPEVPVIGSESEKSFNLKIAIDNVRNDKGYIMVAIYSKKDEFLDEKMATAKLVIPSAEALAGKARTIVLQKGIYGIAVYHDENANGKLDRNWFRYPTESFGFSNGARAITGPPSFDEVAFAVKADTEITISLN